MAHMHTPEHNITPRTSPLIVPSPPPPDSPELPRLPPLPSAFAATMHMKPSMLDIHTQITVGDPKRLRPNRFSTLVQPRGAQEAWDQLGPRAHQEYIMLRSEVPGMHREFFIVRWRWLCWEANLAYYKQLASCVYLHEIAMPNQPVRIFVDIEHDGELAQPGKQARGGAIIKSIIGYIHESLGDFMGGELCDCDPSPTLPEPFHGPVRDEWSMIAQATRKLPGPPVVLECNREGKLSYHAIWDITVEDIHTLGVLMETIMEKESGSSDFLFKGFVDMGVYRKFASLRTPGSRKAACGPFNRVCIDIGVGVTDFRSETKGYITAGTPNTKVYSFPVGSPYLRRARRIQGKPPPPINQGEFMSQGSDAAAHVMALKCLGGVIYPNLQRKYRSDSSWSNRYPDKPSGREFTLNPMRPRQSRYTTGEVVASFGVRPSLPCPKKGSPHKNNGMYMNLRRRQIHTGGAGGGTGGGTGGGAGGGTGGETDNAINAIYTVEFLCADPECNTECVLAMEWDSSPKGRHNGFTPLLDPWGLTRSPLGSKIAAKTKNSFKC